MNVFYDHQTFSLQTYGGISRYHAELIAGINKTVEHQAYVSLLFSNNIHLQECGLNVKQFLPELNIRGKGKFIYYSNQLYTIKKLQQKSYDIFHATYYDPYFTSYLKGKPFVVTFHDMIYEKFNKKYKGLAVDSAIINNKKLLAEQSARIIAVSECTKKDIIDLLEIDPDKIQVIYHGSSLPVIEKNIIKNSQPYLLYVGTRHMYKNFIGLLEAIHTLLKKHKIKLLCAGGGEFTKTEKEFIYSLKADEVVEQRSINDQTLPVLYQNALAFIFPTLYEGFGIPILEAFACDCPCIVSDVSSLPEVAGEAALYMNPTSPDSIVYAIERLLTDSNLRGILVQKGREQLAKFSWQRAVTETVSLYQAII